MSEKHPYEDDLNRSYAVGISVGLGQAAGRMENKAMEAFRLGCDKEAMLYRCEAKELKRLSNEAHPGARP
jgi:hypothetical protein